MRIRRTATLATVVLMLLGAVLDGRAEADAPDASVSQAEAAPGDSVVVTGSRWQPGTIVVLEVCGNEALDGAVDCSPATATDVGVQPDGTFSKPLTVSIPPSPCPCVVQVSSTSEASEVRLPIEVLGAATAPPLARSGVPDIRRRLEVTRAELEGTAFGGWFGLPAKRTLVIDVVNTSDVALQDVAVTVAAGRGDDPTGFVDAADIATIEPGEQQTLRIPVSFDPLQFGELTVAGSIGGAVEPVRFHATTANPPVLPVLVALLVAQWLLLKVRNRLRRRAERLDEGLASERDPEEQTTPSPPSDDHVIDLTGPSVDDRVDVIHLDEAAATSAAVEAADVELPEERSFSLAPEPVDTPEARILRRRAEQVAEALIAASAARSQELEERAARAEAEANLRLLEALDILDRADARALEIQEAAAEVARDSLQYAARRSVQVSRAVGLEGGISNAVSKALAELSLPSGVD